MLNILIPLAGKSIFFDTNNYHYPAPLIEIHGKLMIQRVIDNLLTINCKKQFIFIVNDEDCRKYHLDDILKILVPKPIHVIKLSKPTLGAACSCLMAIEYINNSYPLLISNGDQVIESNLTSLIDYENINSEGAVVYCIEAVHPRWSYVVVDRENNVIEVAEKKPISNKAIAGMYLYGEGSQFISSAMQMIKKRANVDDKYYIAPTLNQLILDDKSVVAIDLNQEEYFSLYTPERVSEYEKILNKRK